MAVHISQGLIEGWVEDDCYRFFGIPYAEPPIEELRWSHPRPPKSWEGVRNCTQFSPVCPQTIGAVSNMRQAQQSEDCLYLNIWTRSLHSSVKRPVMVWIHGGGNMGGAGSEENCDGCSLSAKGVVVVTFNYRLGAFGYINHPDIGANFGLQDQAAALRWIHENIGHFGGNALNVTIFGESAGAVAVRSLLCSPLSEGLFHRAIMQSGGFEEPAFRAAWSYSRTKKATETLFAILGTSEPTELRKIDTSAVKAASHKVCDIPPPPGQFRTPIDLVWMPVEDGKTLIQDGLLKLHQGVPILLGCVENEARYFFNPAVSYSQQTVEGLTSHLCGTYHKNVLALLTKDALSNYDRMDSLMTTVIWLEPAMETLRRLSSCGRIVFNYRFSCQPPGSIRTNHLSKHTLDVRYVFGTFETETESDYYEDNDKSLSEAMQEAWTSFAYNGTPVSLFLNNKLAWPVYDTADKSTISISNSGITIGHLPISPLMDHISYYRIR